MTMGASGVLNGRDALHEQDRVLGNLRVGLGGVLAVVEADAEDLLRFHRCQQPHHLGRLIRDRVGAEDVALDSADHRGGTLAGLLTTVVGSAVPVEITDDSHAGIDNTPVRRRAAVDGGGRPRWRTGQA